MNAKYGIVLGLLVIGLWVSGCGPASTSSPSPVSRLETEDVHALTISPGNPDDLFFGHHYGILKSTDGGDTWVQVPNLRQDAMNLAIGHESPKVMYLAGHNVFMRSQDDGQTWSNVQNNLPGLDLHWFAMHPDDPQKLYTNAVGFGLFSSADGGASWSTWSLETPGGSNITAIAVLGGDPLNVLAGGEDGSLFYSHDEGLTWEQVGSLNGRVMTFTLNRDAGTVYVGTAEGLYRSADGGTSWARLPLNTPIMALAAGGPPPERVVVVNDKGEVFRSDNGGTSW